MEMNRIDSLIANPGVYYDEDAVEGYVCFCEKRINSLPMVEIFTYLILLNSGPNKFFGWYYFIERDVYVPKQGNRPGRYIRTRIKQRLIKKQFLIVARGAAKSIYISTIQGYYLNVDTSTTHQVTTAPTMRQAEEVLSPIRTAITRARGPLFKFLTEGSLQNTTGSRAKRVKLSSTKKGIEFSYRFPVRN